MTFARDVIFLNIICISIPLRTLTVNALFLSCGIGVHRGQSQKLPPTRINISIRHGGKLFSSGSLAATETHADLTRGWLSTTTF